MNFIFEWNFKKTNCGSILFINFEFVGTFFFILKKIGDMEEGTKPHWITNKSD